jgi:hypothetical protein
MREKPQVFFRWDLCKLILNWEFWYLLLREAYGLSPGDMRELKPEDFNVRDWRINVHLDEESRRIRFQLSTDGNCTIDTITLVDGSIRVPVVALMKRILRLGLTDDGELCDAKKEEHGQWYIQLEKIVRELP